LRSAAEQRVAADEDALFKELEEIWSIWSDSAGELRLSNAISWITINFYSAMVSKNEVNAPCFDLIRRHILPTACRENAHFSEAIGCSHGDCFFIPRRHRSEVLYSPSLQDSGIPQTPVPGHG
jgi:hypothetical protein